MRKYFVPLAVLIQISAGIFLCIFTEKIFSADKNMPVETQAATTIWDEVKDVPGGANEKWKYLLQNDEWKPYAKRHDERNLSSHIKHSIRRSNRIAQVILVKCPEILAKLNFTQDELDVLGSVVGTSHHLPGWPMESGVSDKTARAILSILSHRNIETQADYNAYRQERNAKFTKMWDVVKAEKTPDLKWKSFVAHYPSYSLGSFTEAEVELISKWELQTTNYFGEQALVYYSDLVKRLIDSADEKKRLGRMLLIEEEKIDFAPSADKWIKPPTPDLIGRLFEVLTGKTIDSIEKYENYAKSGQDSASFEELTLRGKQTFKDATSKKMPEVIQAK